MSAGCSPSTSVAKEVFLPLELIWTTTESSSRSCPTVVLRLGSKVLVISVSGEIVKV